MAAVITNLTDIINNVNFLYNGSSTPPTSGEEDYLVWTGLANMAINIWENEEGVLWRELFVNLIDAATGTKTTTAGTYSYTVPTDFKFPVSSYVWFGSNYNKTPTRIISPSELQLYENNTEGFGYFLGTKLWFNPNMTLTTGQTITYSYYKKATKLSSGSDVPEMSDPGFIVYYVLSELKKEEGDTSALTIATQKLDAMKTLNEMGAQYQDSSVITPIGSGFGN
jgi:hypothetical protein